MPGSPRIAVVGSAVTDLTTFTDVFPRPGETLFGKGFDLGFGGKGANQAVAARLCGAQVMMVAKVGDDLPGPFHPFNVTGKRAGDFHDVLSEQGLDPVVIVLVRNWDFSKKVDDQVPLVPLLQGLDQIVGKNAKVRIAVAAVFLNDDLKDVVKNDDLRKKYAEKVETFKTDAKLNNIVLGLDNADGPKGYVLNADAEVTVLVCNRLKVVANYAFRKDRLENENAAAIVAAVKEKLGGGKK